MEPISIKEIISFTSGALLSGSDEEYIESVSIDSRKIGDNSLFVPIKGEKVDAHNFIEDALKLGAVASLTEKNSHFNNATIIRVEDTIKALQNIAKNYRNKFSIPVIGVTGSVGKSTTKEMVASALGHNLRVLKNEKNMNSQIGLPLTLLNLNKTHQMAVIEMGISMPGEMERIANITNADVAIISNIGYSHIGNFGSIENIRDEKLKVLSDHTKKYYLNGDNPLLAGIDRNKYPNVTYFGLNGDYPYKAEDISFTDESTNFVLVTKDFKENITIPCLGMHNVYNALSAIAVSLEMGVYLDDIKKGLSQYRPLSMRQNIFKLKDNITLIDDSYNASPDAVKSAISVLRSLKSKGKNVVIIADILELGEQSYSIHFDLGRYISLENIDVLIAIGEETNSLVTGAKSTDNNMEIQHFMSNDDALNYIVNKICANDKILVKGSRGMHTETIANALKDKFSL